MPKPISCKGSRINTTWGAEQHVTENLVPGQENIYADADKMTAQLRQGLAERGVRLPSMQDFENGSLVPQIGQHNPLLGGSNPVRQQQVQQNQNAPALQGANFKRAKDNSGKRKVQSQTQPQFQEFDLSHFDDENDNEFEENMSLESEGFDNDESDFDESDDLGWNELEETNSAEPDDIWGANDFDDDSMDEVDFDMGGDFDEEDSNEYWGGV